MWCYCNYFSIDLFTNNVIFASFNIYIYILQIYELLSTDILKILNSKQSTNLWIKLL